jgi:type I restriction enzyme S subunit
LGEFRNGVNFTRDQKVGPQGVGLGLVNVKDIFVDGPYLDFRTLDKVALLGKKGIAEYLVSAGDLFFVRSSVKREGVGFVSMPRESDQNTVHCGFVIRFRVTAAGVDPLFLTYMLRSPHYRQAIINLSSGAAITNISQRSLASLEIALPPLPTQRKIAAVLSAYDDLIKNNMQRINILEEMGQALYHEWFVKFHFPGHERVQLVDSPMGSIPQGWRAESILDVSHFRLVRENVRPYHGLKRYFATADVNGLELVGEGIEYSYGDKPSRAQKQPMLDSVWFARMKETYKVLPFTRTNERLANSCILSSGFAGFEATSTGWFGFLFFTIDSLAFHERKDLYCTGATQVSLTNEGLGRIRVLVPDNQIVLRYSRLAEPTVDNILALQAKNAILRRTRDLLLPKVISGELDVSELDMYIGEEVT